MTTGKPFELAARLIASGSERQKQQILTDTMIACADSVVLGILTPDKAAKRVGTLIGVDDSDDHERICLALEETDRKEPRAVEKIIACLPATKLQQLDPTTGPSAELLIDYATAQQLATLARYYTGKIYAAMTQTRKSSEDEASYQLSDKDLIAQSKIDNARRGLGRLLDLIVDRNDEDGDGLLESFGTALLGDQSITSKTKAGKSTTASFMIDEIIYMAIHKRSSAARVIENLPDGDPDGWDAKLTLRKNIT